MARRKAEDNGGTQAELVTQGVLAAAIVLAVGMILLMAAKGSQEGFSQIFLDEKAIPPSASAGALYPVTFVIENFEGRSAMYAYSVKDSGGAELGEGAVIVADGKRMAVTETVVLNTRGAQKVFIYVSVDGMRELSLFFPVDVA
ncbi:MAG: hypothetical protein V1787_01650 [Candidatus Micrarchaeota archaeon]